MKVTFNTKSGFTMVELLVVLVIIGILAAVATPIFLGNTQKAKASEAVAIMSLVRQAQRDYFINNNSYITTIAKGKIGEAVPTGVGVNTGVAQYFGNDAIEVVAASSAQAPFKLADSTDTTQAIDAQDFIIRVSGAQSLDCSSEASASKNCALKKKDVEDFVLEMDNTGRTYVSYEKGAPGTWQKF